MPYEVKNSTSTENNAIKKGSIALGINNVNYGPSSVTGFYTGPEIPEGGYVVYQSSGGNIYAQVAADDAGLINLAREASGNTYATVAEGLEYFSQQNDRFVVSSKDNIPNLVTDGLVLNMNAQSGFSYPKTGSEWYDISGDGNSGSLTNGPTFDENGAIVFDGVDDYVSLPTYPDFTSAVTFNVWVMKTELKNSAAVYSFKGCMMQFDNSAIRFWFDVNKGNVTYTFTPTLNRWYNITVTQEDYLNKIYVDSSLVLTTTTQFPLHDGSAYRKRQIGVYNDRYFLGSIPTVQVYDRALSAQEIKQNYFQSPIVTDGLVFAADAGNIVSYESGSTTTYSLTGSSSGSLINGTGFDRGNGGSFVFDGVDDYIEFSNTTLSSLGISNGDPITLICFFKPHDLQQNMIMSFFDAPRCYIEMFTRDGGSSAVVHWGFGSVNNSQTSTAYVEVGNIYCYTATYDGSTAKGYLNGGINSTDSIGAQTFNNNYFRIGKYTSANPFQANITLYTAQIYNRALSADEVQQNFKAQRKRFGL